MKWTGHIFLFLSISLSALAALDLTLPVWGDHARSTDPFRDIRVNDLIPLPAGLDRSFESLDADLYAWLSNGCSSQIEERVNSQISSSGLALPELTAVIQIMEELPADSWMRGIYEVNPSQEVIYTVEPTCSDDRIADACVPEPATLGMLAMGALLLFGMTQRDFTRG